MGEIRARIKLENFYDLALKELKKLGRKKVRAREIDAIVDTGAVMNLFPQDLVEDLGLRIFDRRVVILANDQKIELPIAGPLQITVAGRAMTSDCLVGPPGCTPLIGQLVMEGLDLICDPAKRTLTVRPESPLRPTIPMRRSSGEPVLAS